MPLAGDLKLGRQAFFISAENCIRHTQTNDGLIIHNNRETTTGQNAHTQKNPAANKNVSRLKSTLTKS